jgi:hypothetical protein
MGLFASAMHLQWTDIPYSRAPLPTCVIANNTQMANGYSREYPANIMPNRKILNLHENDGIRK